MYFYWTPAVIRHVQNIILLLRCDDVRFSLRVKSIILYYYYYYYDPTADFYTAGHGKQLFSTVLRCFLTPFMARRAWKQGIPAKRVTPFGLPSTPFDTLLTPF